MEAIRKLLQAISEKYNMAFSEWEQDDEFRAGMQADGDVGGTVVSVSFYINGLHKPSFHMLCQPPLNFTSYDLTSYAIADFGKEEQEQALAFLDVACRWGVTKEECEAAWKEYCRL